jgi:hypothetical protein
MAYVISEKAFDKVKEYLPLMNSGKYEQIPCTNTRKVSWYLRQALKADKEMKLGKFRYDIRIMETIGCVHLIPCTEPGEMTQHVSRRDLVNVLSVANSLFHDVPIVPTVFPDAELTDEDVEGINNWCKTKKLEAYLDEQHRLVVRPEV